MNKERGNVSVALLFIGLFLVVGAQLVMVYVSRNVELAEECWRGRQLRMLCSSVMEALAYKDLPKGEAIFWEAPLYPGNVPVAVATKVDFDNDNLLRYLEVKTQAQDLTYKLRNLQFSLNEEALQLARQYMLVSGKEVVGTEYLSDESIYTSAEEVTIPQIDFLKNTSADKKSISDLAMEDVKLYGLDNRFYYLSNASTPLTFTKNLKVYGTAVIATEGSVIIDEGCQFFDRVIFLSKGNIIIKEGVELPQTLLMAYGKVSISAGCKIGGVIFSGGNIEILGETQLTHDENVVAPFSSAYYIL